MERNFSKKRFVNWTARLPMKTYSACSAIGVMLLSLLTANMTGAQLAPLCVENSPERRGEVGCSIIENKPLPDGLKELLFWHIDALDSPERARAAVGPTSVAFEADGKSWLMTLESQTSDHHGGRHVAQVGPLPLLRAPKLSMQIMSAALSPGMYSLADHHSGVEAIYVIKGDACFETPTRAFKLRKGETLALPGGTPHRAVVLGILRFATSCQSSSTTRRKRPRCAWTKEQGHSSSHASNKFGLL